MNDMNGSKINFGDLEKAVAEATESKAVGRFARVAFEAALSLRKIAKRLTDLEYVPRKVNRPFKGRTVQVKGKWHYGLIRNILSRIELDLHE